MAHNDEATALSDLNKKQSDTPTSNTSDSFFDEFKGQTPDIDVEDPKGLESMVLDAVVNSLAKAFGYLKASLTNTNPMGLIDSPPARKIVQGLQAIAGVMNKLEPMLTRSGDIDLDGIVTSMEALDVMFEEEKVAGENQRINPFAPNRPPSPDVPIAPPSNFVPGQGFTPPPISPPSNFVPGQGFTPPPAVASPPPTDLPRVTAPAGPDKRPPSQGAAAAAPVQNALNALPPVNAQPGPPAPEQELPITPPAPERAPILASLPGQPAPDVPQAQSVDRVLGDAKPAEQNYDTMEFGQAFRAARTAGLKEFTWRGKRFTTQIDTESAGQFNQNQTL